MHSRNNMTLTSDPKCVDLTLQRVVLTSSLQYRQTPKRMQHILGFSSGPQQKPHLSPTVSPNISAWNGKKKKDKIWLGKKVIFGYNGPFILKQQINWIQFSVSSLGLMVSSVLYTTHCTTDQTTLYNIKKLKRQTQYIKNKLTISIFDGEKKHSLKQK